MWGDKKVAVGCCNFLLVLFTGRLVLVGGCRRVDGFSYHSGPEGPLELQFGELEGGPVQLDIESLLHGVQGGVVQQTLEPWVLAGLGLGQRVEYDIVDIALLAAGVFLQASLSQFPWLVEFIGLI